MDFSSIDERRWGRDFPRNDVTKGLLEPAALGQMNR
jgi:hypothetical protein